MYRTTYERVLPLIVVIVSLLIFVFGIWLGTQHQKSCTLQDFINSNAGNVSGQELEYCEVHGNVVSPGKNGKGCLFTPIEEGAINIMTTQNWAVIDSLATTTCKRIEKTDEGWIFECNITR